MTVGLAITVLTIAALCAPVAAEMRIAAAVNARRLATVTSGRKSTGGAVAVAQCPQCPARGSHLFISRFGNRIRRECRTCGVQWTEAL